MPFPGALPASLGKRLLAFVIDVTASVVLGGAFAAVGTVQAVSAAREGRPVGLGLVGGGYVVLAGLGAFQLWFQGARGYTIGKRCVGLRTLSAATGQPVGVGRMVLRACIVAAGCLVAGVGELVVWVSPLFDSTGRRQGWHDKAAGTMVFDVAAGVDPALAPTPRASAAAWGMDGATPAVVAPGPVGGGASAATPGFVSAPPRSMQPVPPPLAEASSHDVLSAASGAPAIVPRVDAGGVPIVRDANSGAPSIAAVVGARGSTIVSSAPGGPGAAGEPHVEGSGSARGRHFLVDHVPGEARRVEETVEPPASRVPGTVLGGIDRESTSDEHDDVEETRLAGGTRVARRPDQASRPTANLRLWDGRIVVLTGTALVGRNPLPREGEQAPERIITVADAGRSVSKTHVAVGVDGAGAWVCDRSSTNGTVVTLRDGRRTQCAPEQEVRVPSGTSVVFGDYWFIID
jgi:uncharacterized RDD family membrane protein YckC